MNTLKSAVIKWLDMTDEEAEETLKDVSMYGADFGVPNFTYYSETCKFFQKNKSLIINALNEDAASFGENVIDMVHGFNCLRGGNYTKFEIAEALYGRYNADKYCQIYNALA